MNWEARAATGDRASVLHAARPWSPFVKAILTQLAPRAIVKAFLTAVDFNDRSETHKEAQVLLLRQI